MSDPLLPASLDHPERRLLTNELHARPFQALTPPAQVAFVAIDSGGLDREAARAHLGALLKTRGVAEPPPPEINHAAWKTDGVDLRWERHTEFITYTVTRPGAPTTPFDVSHDEFFPRAWVADAPGKVIAAVLSQIEICEHADAVEETFLSRYASMFAAESLAAAWLAGRQAMAMADFRIDDNGFVRFGLLGVHGIGPRRLGRLTQRLTELETYRMLSMRALPQARSLSGRLAEIDRSLADIVSTIGGAASEPAAQPLRGDPDRERALLSELTSVAARLERMSAESAFRFGASRAYEAIVEERLEVIREERVLERQTFSEFMVRRYKPAMRTVRSVEQRLDALAQRAERAAQLLRTRVDVTLEAQNQELLESMNRRAELQLRLQQTVEGLSVVAISYYAVSLAGYLLAPFAALLGVSAKIATAAVALPIIAAVFLFVRRIRQTIEKRSSKSGADATSAD